MIFSLKLEDVDYPEYKDFKPGDCKICPFSFHHEELGTLCSIGFASKWCPITVKKDRKKKISRIENEKL